jgi:lipoprotein-releasing system permease protein
MGIAGTVLGLLAGLLLIRILSGVYVGDPIGYFPTSHDPAIFIKAAIFGMTVSIGAGYFPARKASKVDPVSIFRK